MTVTFDFDNTLTQKGVQDFFCSLIKKGVDVWILTSRYDEINKQKYPKNPTNDDLYKLIDSLKFPRDKVIFCNMKHKFEYLKDKDILWHLDDDLFELNYINKMTKTKGISVHGNWNRECKKLLK